MRLVLWLLPAVLVAAVAATAADPPAEVPVTPAEVIAACAADAARIPADKARSVRWISLHNAPTAKDRETWAKVISGHINGLSREPDIVVPDRVGPWLLRIDTLDYGSAFAKAWEKLGTVEPYWHGEDLQPADDEYEEVTVEYGYWVKPDGTRRAGGRQQSPDEKWETTRTEKERRRKPTKTVKGFGPWIARDARAKAAFEVLQAKCGGTNNPVVAAEWLLYQTAIEEDRNPGYYEFQGWKDQKDYEESIGFVRKGLDPSFLKELREAVANSTVTIPDVLRRIVRLQAAGGGYWYTQDSHQQQTRNRDKGNPLFNLGDDFEFQAAELYGMGANGLWKTAAADAQGKLAKSVPPQIASDATAPHADRRVHPNLSCLRCHTEGGLQEVDGWVRGVLNSPPNFLNGRTPDEQRTLRQQYVTRRLEPFLKADRERYAASLWEATGMKPAEYAAATAKLWQQRAEDPVTVDRAARDLGCTVKELQDALAKLGAKIDPNLAAFRLPRPRGIPVVLWVRGGSYQRAMDALHGYSRPFAVKEK